MNSFYSDDELLALGFKSLGTKVLISRNAQFYDSANISIGSHVRIDDFCILSGNITLGSYIHISAYTVLYGKYGIVMEDYTGLSPRCTVFSATDDFSGDYLMSPMADAKYTNVQGGTVTIKRYVQVGASCVILPKVTIEEGVVVGAMSMVNHTLPAWGIYAGVPAKRIKERKRGLLKFME